MSKVSFAALQPGNNFELTSITELHRLSRPAKLKIIEDLWSDLAADGGEFPSPAWHREELQKTAKDFATGKIKLLDWEDTKKELRRQLG